MDPFLSIHLDYILPANAVMDSGAHTNAIAKYVVLEAHTQALICSLREADESGS